MYNAFTAYSAFSNSILLALKTRHLSCVHFHELKFQTQPPLQYAHKKGTKKIIIYVLLCAHLIA